MHVRSEIGLSTSTPFKSKSDQRSTTHPLSSALSFSGGRPL